MRPAVSASPDLALLVTRGERALRVVRYGGGASTDEPAAAPSALETLLRLAATGTPWIGWVDEALLPLTVPPSEWPALVRHPLELLHLGSVLRTDRSLGGYRRVEFDSPFLAPPPEGHAWTSWAVSSAAGIARREVLRRLLRGWPGATLGAALAEAGYRGLRAGLVPRSDPALLARTPPPDLAHRLAPPLGAREEAALVVRTLGRRWLPFWLLGRLLFDLRPAPWAAFRALSVPRPEPVDLRDLFPQRLHVEGRPGVDVVIPTLGRPGPLADVLRDLGAQTLPPQRVFVVDQRPDDTPPDPLPACPWPFEVERRVTARMGACHSRNLALVEADAPWVLFLDDDVRLPDDLVESLLTTAATYSVDAVSGAVHLPTQAPIPADGDVPRPWSTLGTCVCLVRGECLAGLRFDERLEGGYGEDYDLGMQLRRRGTEVLYDPRRSVLHLKVPAGGFRRPFPHPWNDEAVVPRPSPTVLLSRAKHLSATQREGYHLYYFLRRLSRVEAYRWPGEFARATREWRAARRWTDHLAARPETPS